MCSFLKKNKTKILCISPLVKKEDKRLGMVAYSGGRRIQISEFEASVVYVRRPCLRTKAKDK